MNITPEQMIQDPQILELEDWLKTKDRAFVFALCVNKDTAPEVLARLAKTNDIAFLRGVAANPNTPPDILREWADSTVADFVAINPNTPAETREKLANHASPKIRGLAKKSGNWCEWFMNTETLLKDWESHIALWLMEDPQFFNNNSKAIDKAIRQADPEHPIVVDTSQCPIYLLVMLTAHKTNNPQILERLAQHPSYGTRMAVAQNYATPAHVLERLSMDKRSSVRQNVASNPNTPPEVLEKLSSSDCIQMLQCVLTNPSTPAHVLESFSKYDKEGYKGFCKYYVAQNPSTPPHVLERLASDDGYLVRGAAAMNQSTPTEIVKKLLLDDFSHVQERAKRALKKRLDNQANIG